MFYFFLGVDCKSIFNSQLSLSGIESGLGLAEFFACYQIIIAGDGQISGQGSGNQGALIESPGADPAWMQWYRDNDIRDGQVRGLNQRDQGFSQWAESVKPVLVFELMQQSADRWLVVKGYQGVVKKKPVAQTESANTARIQCQGTDRAGMPDCGQIMLAVVAKPLAGLQRMLAQQAISVEKSG